MLSTKGNAKETDNLFDNLSFTVCQPQHSPVKQNIMDKKDHIFLLTLNFKIT